MNLRRDYYKLNATVIEKVCNLAEYGAALEHITVDVSYTSLKLTEEELALFATLHEGRVKSAHKFINTIINYIQDDDSKFVQWCSLIHPLTVAITPIMLP